MPALDDLMLFKDGIVKFWKKRPQEIEFIKKFFAHTGSVRDVSISSDGLWLATLGQRSVVFDVFLLLHALAARNISLRVPTECSRAMLVRH